MLRNMTTSFNSINLLAESSGVLASKQVNYIYHSAMLVLVDPTPKSKTLYFVTKKFKIYAVKLKHTFS